MFLNEAVLLWVEEMAQITKPDRIQWINGSEEEKKSLIKQALDEGELLELNQEELPGCYLHRTAVNDVARVEHRTFICTPTKEEAGHTNNWMPPEEAYSKLRGIFDSSMSGRTMYVIPYLMGPKGSPFSKVGIELTDSIYVVLNMGIMTRMGDVAIEHLKESKDFVKGLHSKAKLDEENRYICHFPQDNTIWSVNSGYGGNVLLGKKCFALRIASFMGRKEGWLAEHMLILGVENPKGEVSYIAAAFPSACGKTNLAMLIPPKAFEGYKVWTVGDDIAWMRIGEDGRLYAMNPEAGFFGVAPGTSMTSNPNALMTAKRNTIFTNVVETPDKGVWWEGIGTQPPDRGINWRGEEWVGKNGDKGAHPNSRFTAPASQCPSISPEWENPKGVPISAILFGGRRAKVAPLVYESFNWEHGVFIGATMASETTAASTGAVGVVRRDPMAMLPFCGYNMGEYFRHWLNIGNKLKKTPKIFNVNWFKTDEDGKFLWPGYGENFRVLKWILDRCNNSVDAVTTPVGLVPKCCDINLSGLESINEESLKSLLSIDKASWDEEVKSQEEFLSKFSILPGELRAQHAALKERVKRYSCGY